MRLATQLAVSVLLAALPTAGTRLFAIADLSPLERRLRELDKRVALKRAAAGGIGEARNKNEELKRRLEWRLSPGLIHYAENCGPDQDERQIFDIAAKSGLKVVRLQPGPAENRSGGARLYEMVVEGRYHELAVFLESVSKLRDTVNARDLTIEFPPGEADSGKASASFKLFVLALGALP